MSNTSARRVTFLEAVEVQECLHLYNYTPSEISATWYDAVEMDKISQRCYDILRRHEKEVRRNKPKYCIRGLECVTSTGYISKKNIRSAAFEAVFREQEKLWDEIEEIRVQAISDAYHRTSSSCQMWAQVVGNRDQKAVEAYLYDDDEEWEIATLPPSIAASLPKPQKSPYPRNLGVRCLVRQLAVRERHRVTRL